MSEVSIQSLTIYVSRNILVDSLRIIRDVDETTCKIIHEHNLKEEKKLHPSYMLGPTELVPVIVSGLGLATGVVALINSLIELKKAKLKSNEVQIQVKERIIIIQSDTKLEDVSKLLSTEEE